MKYKICFRGSNKQWTSDLPLIKKYSQVLKNDCLQIFMSATILVKSKESTDECKLSEWLKSN